MDADGKVLGPAEQHVDLGLFRRQRMALAGDHLRFRRLAVGWRSTQLGDAGVDLGKARTERHAAVEQSLVDGLQLRTQIDKCSIVGADGVDLLGNVVDLLGETLYVLALLRYHADDGRRIPLRRCGRSRRCGWGGWRLRRRRRGWSSGLSGFSRRSWLLGMGHKRATDGESREQKHHGKAPQKAKGEAG